LDSGGVGQVGKSEIAQNLRAILDVLEGRDRLLGRVDVAQADRVQLKNRGEKGGEEDNGDEGLWKSNAGDMELGGPLRAKVIHNYHKSQHIMCLYSRSCETRFSELIKN
jgi:hypothetical protein